MTPRLSSQLRPALLVCSLLLVSCTHRYGPEAVHDIGRYMTLQPGLSTKQDVYQRFGQPGDVLPAGTGVQWLYLHAATAIHGATFVPYIGLAAGGNTIDLTRATFVFDAAEYFQRVETSQGSRYQNMWSGIGETMQATNDAQQHVRTAMGQLGMPFDEEAWSQAKTALKLRPSPSKEPPTP